MFVFVSYPREYEVIASRLDAQLRDHVIDTFLDKEDLDDGAVWNVRIGESIKRAGIYVVLYSPEAAKPERTFFREIKRIQTECQRNISKKLITIIFPPTKPRDLLPYFSNRQCRIAEAKGEIDHESHSFWIDQVVQDIERFNEIEKLEKAQKDLEEAKKNEEIRKIKSQNRPRQIIARITLASAGGIIIFMLYNKPWSPVDGESVCHSLMGSYALHQNYVFNEGVNARSVATNAVWKAANCEYNPRLDGYILKGEEETDFDIEAIINGKFERIATARYQYKSEVYIGKDEALLGRSFEAVLHPQNINKSYKDRYGNNFNKPEEFFDKIIKEIIEMRNKKHRELKTSPCIPAQGETGGRITLAFVCSGYTRTMVKMS